jgi:hypothetical protein
LSGDVLVQVETDGHRSGCFFQAFLAELRFEQGRLAAAELLRECALVSHLLLDLVDVLKIVGQRGVDAGEGDGRDMRYDLIGSQALMFMPRHDVEHANAMAADAGFPAANPPVSC